MEKLKQLTREYLNKVEVMQLATQSDGQPWCCTVHFFADDAFNIYWMSTPQRRHSQEIGEGAKVAVAMVIETGPDKPVVGVQIEGDAKRIDQPTKEAVHGFAARHHRDDAWAASVLDGSSEHKLYRLTPRLIQLFDKQQFPDDPQQQWQP